jgi:hypothetical protein
VLAQVQGAIDEVEAVLASLDPDVLDGQLATRYVELFARLERLGAAGKALAARRVVATKAWNTTGAHRDPAGWMAALSGTTVAQAAAELDTASRLEALPCTEAAMRAGELSSAQAAAITDAATADPHSERALLERASTDGVKGLRDECARVKAAARADELAHHRRIHQQRALRSFTDREGAGRIEIRGTVESTARIMRALEPFEREQFELVRASGERERADAIAFDAMVAMADHSVASERDGHGSSGPAAVVTVRVDDAALRRGHTVPGEVCEIAGAGPIPVAVASRLLDDAILRVLLLDGDDVLTVSSARRTIPARVRAALEERQPECGLEGCHVDRHLEIDHNVPLEAGGRTELANLNRLCRFHHRHKHEHDLRVAGTGTRLRFVTADGHEPGRAPP